VVGEDGCEAWNGEFGGAVCSGRVFRWVSGRGESSTYLSRRRDHLLLASWLLLVDFVMLVFVLSVALFRRHADHRAVLPAPGGPKISVIFPHSIPFGASCVVVAITCARRVFSSASRRGNPIAIF